MRHNYNIDRLIDYSLTNFDETTKVINPQWRSLDYDIRKQVSILNRKQAEFGAISLDSDIDANAFIENQNIKSILLEEIENLKNKIKEKKIERKATKKRICFSDLPEEAKFKQLNPHAKHFVDTIKMISYRAETCMVNTLKEKLPRAYWDSSRSIIKGIYASSTDFKVDEKNNTLTIKLHHQSNDRYDNAVRYLCEELTETETHYPGTNLRLIYKLVSD